MTQRALVHFGGTTLQLPARDGYEREILFDFVLDATHRHRRVQLRAGHHRCTLRATPPATGTHCVDCGRGIRVVLSESDHALLCMPCLWRRVLSDSEAPAAARPHH